MARDMKLVERDAMTLPPAERAKLAERLIASLDDIDDAECERLWIDEADRRFRAYKEGLISARLAKDALREVRGSLK